MKIFTVINRAMLLGLAYTIALYIRQTYLSAYLTGASKFSSYLEFFPLCLLGYFALSYLEGVYAIVWNRRTFFDRCLGHFKINGLLLAFITLAAFFVQYHLFSRTFLVLFVGISLVLHLILEIAIQKHRQQGKKILFLGLKGFGQMLRQWVNSQNLGIVFLDEKYCLEGAESMYFALNKFEPDEIYYCQVPMKQREEIQQYIVDHDLNCVTRDLTSLSRVFTGSQHFEKYGDYLREFILEPSAMDWSNRLKRLFDFWVTFLTLPVWGSLCFMIWLVMKSLNGDPLFTQLRVGQLGRVFRIYKFRTMVITIDHNKPEGSEDRRFVTFGWFLRRTSLDELPQLLNVLTGDMSLVGPRPEMIPIVDASYSSLHWKRVLLKPGMTGLWQINGRKQPIHDHLKYDFFYLKHRSFALDLLILLKTIPAVLFRKGAT